MKTIRFQTRVASFVISGALLALLSPGRVMAQGNAVPNDSSAILLKGLYGPVVKGPNLGLSMVDLNDGSTSKTRSTPLTELPVTRTKKRQSVTFTRSSRRGICVPTTSREVRLQCASYGGTMSLCSRRGLCTTCRNNRTDDLQFTAHNYITVDNLAGTAVIKGFVTDGPLAGERVDGEYRVIRPCGIINAQIGSGGDVCFQGNLVIRPGSAD